MLALPDKFNFYAPANKSLLTPPIDFKHKQIIINCYNYSVLI